MKRKSGWMIAVIVTVAALAAPVLWAEEAAAPNPKVAERAAEIAIENNNPDAVDPNDIRGEDWTLEFQFEPPTAILVKMPDGTKQVFWYLVYTVTNNTKEAHGLVPAFTLMSSGGVVRQAGIYPTAYEAIKTNRKVPFLENALKMIGPVHPGPDSARTGVAIFAPLDTRAEMFSIFVEGLSGRFIERPKVQGPGAAKAAPAAQKAEGEKKPAAEEKPAPKKRGAAEKTAAGEPGKPTAQDIAAKEAANLRLRKTLELQYKVPGEDLWINLDKPVFVGKRWTWR